MFLIKKIVVIIFKILQVIVLFEWIVKFIGNKMVLKIYSILYFKNLLIQVFQNNKLLQDKILKKLMVVLLFEENGQNQIKDKVNFLEFNLKKYLRIISMFKNLNNFNIFNKKLWDQKDLVILKEINNLRRELLLKLLKKKLQKEMFFNQFKKFYFNKKFSKKFILLINLIE